MDIPEDVFWTAEIPFLDRIVANKTAYDEWLSSIMEKERKRVGKK